MGHDWGAVIAWSLGIYYPSFVDKLVICNVPHPGVFTKYLKNHRSQLRKSWYMFFFQLPFLPEFFTKLGHHKFLIKALKSSTYRFSKEELFRYQKAWSNPNSLTGMINWYRAIFRLKRIPPKNGNLKMPILIIWGVKDMALEHPLAKLSLKKCENGKLVYYPDATHWVQHEKSKEMKKLITNFIKKK